MLQVLVSGLANNGISWNGEIGLPSASAESGDVGDVGTVVSPNNSRVCATHLNKIHVSSQISKILVFKFKHLTHLLTGKRCN